MNIFWIECRIFVWNFEFFFEIFEILYWKVNHGNLFCSAWKIFCVNIRHWKHSKIFRSGRGKKKTGRSLLLFFTFFHFFFFYFFFFHSSRSPFFFSANNELYIYCHLGRPNENFIQTWLPITFFYFFHFSLFFFFHLT